MIIELEVCLQLKLRDCESKLASNIELGSLINVRRKVIAYSTHVIASIGGEIASRREGGGGGVFARVFCSVSWIISLIDPQGIVKIDTWILQFLYLFWFYFLPFLLLLFWIDLFSFRLSFFLFVCFVLMEFDKKLIGLMWKWIRWEPSFFRDFAGIVTQQADGIVRPVRLQPPFALLLHHANSR